MSENKKRPPVERVFKLLTAYLHYYLSFTHPLVKSKRTIKQKNKKKKHNEKFPQTFSTQPAYPSTPLYLARLVCLARESLAFVKGYIYIPCVCSGSSGGHGQIRLLEKVSPRPQPSFRVEEEESIFFLGSDRC